MKLYEEFVNEAYKFKLSPALDDAINLIENKKRAQQIEQLVVKYLLTDFIKSMATSHGIIFPKNFPTLNTQQKIDYLINDPVIANKIRLAITSKIAGMRDYALSNTITARTFQELFTDTANWHASLEKDDKEIIDKKATRIDETPKTDKFITYPNGWYWINLNTSFSRDEANNMGHCGNDSGKILFSLRDNNSNSHITVSYDEDDEAMCQCKGRSNSKPKNEYHKYIIDLLLNEKYPFNLIVTGSYKPELDFNLQDLNQDELEDLISKKPSLEYTDDMFEIYMENKDYVKIVSMVENNFYYDGTKTITDVNFLKFVLNQKLDMEHYIRIFNLVLDENTNSDDLDFCIEYLNLAEARNINDIYYLWKFKKITDGEAETKITDLKIIDGKWNINWEFTNWGEFAFLYDPEKNISRNAGTIREYVENSIDEDEYGYIFYDDLSSVYLGDISNESIENIFNVIEKNGYELEEYEIEEIIDNSRFDIDEGQFSMEIIKSKILNDSSRNLLNLFLELETLSDIKDSILRSYDVSQENANSTAKFNAFIKPLLGFFKMEKIVWSDSDYGSYLLLPFDISFAILLKKMNWEEKTLSGIIKNIFDENTREDALSEYGIESDQFPEYLNIDYPYNGWDGNVTKKDLNDEITEKLSEL